MIATDRDFNYGVLNSYAHPVWRDRRQSTLEDLPQYANEVFGSFPFPQPGDTQQADVEKWGRHLDAAALSICKLLPDGL